jgi:hypothetical protein
MKIWRGNFLEATPMWHGRGETQLGLPMGSIIEFSGRPSLAFLQNQSNAWPEKNENYNYIGYDLDNIGRPVFKYAIGNTRVREYFYAEDDGKKLIHALNVNSIGEGSELWCKIAEGSQITLLPNGLYAINDKEYLIEVPKKTKPVIREAAGNTKELLLPVKAKNNEAEIKYAIIW